MASAAFSLLVPVDFSPVSIKALHEAKKFANRMGASLTLLHVRPISDVRAAIAEGREDLLRGPSRPIAGAMKRHYSERLAALAARFDADETRFASGRASREIVRAAKAFDLVVMAARAAAGSPASWEARPTKSSQPALSRSPSCRPEPRKRPG